LRSKLRFINFKSILLCCALSSQSALAHAGTKKVTINSFPEGAQVDVNGSMTCTTPCVLTVNSAYFGAKHTAFSGHVDEPLTIRLFKEGFLPKDARLTSGPLEWRSFNGANSFRYYLIESDNFTFRLDPVQAFLGQTAMMGGSSATATLAEPGSPEFVIHNALPAIVQVETSQGSGSGFFITAEGLLATNAHVLAGQQSVMIITSDGKSLQSSSVYEDQDRDLALVKVEAHGVPFLQLSPTLPMLGADVIAIGTPGAHDALGTVMLPNSVTKGVVSGVRAFSDTTVANIPGRAGTWIQTDATINHGNSGGPLLGKSGLVVGINTLSFSGTGTPGINFALSSSELAQVVKLRLGIELSSVPQPVGAKSSSAAKLAITSTPDGADIEVDGVFLGNTPSEISVAEGKRVIRVTKKGYVPYERTIQAQPNGSQRISAELDPLQTTP
jgi:serine protease Do